MSAEHLTAICVTSFSSASRRHFHQNNAHMQTSRISQKCLYQDDLFPWFPCLIDSCLIRNFQEQKIHQIYKSSSIEGLKVHWQNPWTTVTQDTLRNLIVSMDEQSQFMSIPQSIRQVTIFLDKWWLRGNYKSRNLGFDSFLHPLNNSMFLRGTGHVKSVGRNCGL